MDEKQKQIPMWLDRHPVLHPDHVHDLENRAAINEFHHRMPRMEAEDRAFKSYVHDQHLDAATHHLAGIKAAHAAGDMESARKHGALYNMHMEALGLDPMAAPPPEIAAKLREEPPQVYKFKPHKGDLYALTQTSEKNSSGT